MNDDELLHALRNSKGWPTLGNAAAERHGVRDAKTGAPVIEPDIKS